MRIEFTGRQMEITPDLRTCTETRLHKLTRILRDPYDVHVILTAEKHRRGAEITLKFRDRTLVGIAETGDSRSSINDALDKLERQALRLIERRRTRRRRPKPTAAIRLNVLGWKRLNHQPQRILETERIPIKPMTVQEAIEALDASGNGVIVFRNPATERVNVIYQRPDGHLGLIEPEP